jgi:hypothetical protein
MIEIAMEQQRIADLACRNCRAEQKSLALLASQGAQDIKRRLAGTVVADSCAIPIEVHSLVFGL